MKNGAFWFAAESAAAAEAVELALRNPAEGADQGDENEGEAAMPPMTFTEAELRAGVERARRSGLDVAEPAKAPGCTAGWQPIGRAAPKRVRFMPGVGAGGSPNCEALRLKDIPLRSEQPGSAGALTWRLLAPPGGDEELARAPPATPPALLLMESSHGEALRLLAELLDPLLLGRLMSRRGLGSADAGGRCLRATCISRSFRISFCLRSSTSRKPTLMKCRSSCSLVILAACRVWLSCCGGVIGMAAAITPPPAPSRRRVPQGFGQARRVG